MRLSSSQHREGEGAVASESPFSTDFLLMPHFDHIHDESVIFYRIGNPINALTNTRAILIAGELFTAGRTGRFSQNLDAANNLLTVLFILDGCYLFSRRRLDEGFIFGHGVSTFSRIGQSPSSAHSLVPRKPGYLPHLQPALILRLRSPCQKPIILSQPLSIVRHDGYQDRNRW